MKANIRAAIKLALFCVMVLSYFIVTPVFLLTYTVLPKLSRICITQILKFYSQLCLKLFALEVDDKVYAELNENYFIVCNHLSYLDIMIIASKIPAMFVTSMSIKRTPFLGQICTLGGCLFVNRSSRNNRQHELEELEEALRQGFSVTVFPEATSTNGERIKQFKMALYESAIKTSTPILPLCLNYYAHDYQMVTTKNRDNIFWYGDMSFFPHFWKMLKSKKIHARLYQAPIMRCSSYDSKKEVADKSRELVSEFYRPIIV